MKKRLLILIFILSIFVKINAVNYFGYPFSVKFFTSISAAYNYKISTDYSYQTNGIFMTIPLDFSFDFRFIEWFSINPGISFLYGINSYTSTYSSESIGFYNHNLFIRLPFTIKFYPMVYKSDSYANFFLGVGLYGYFWAVNGYYYERNGKQYYGNRYSTSSALLPPDEIYTPANIGIKLSLGNNFQVAKNTFFGLELFADYLFLPICNGYYNNINYKPSGNVLLEFSGSVGVAVSIGFQVYGEE